MQLQDYFSNIEDVRQQSKVEHLLVDIISLSILAIICGANEYKEIEIFGKSKESFLKNYLSLKNGIPSHDTIERVLSVIKPKSFLESFMNFSKSLCTKNEDLICFDGKTLRGSYDENSGKSAIHIVNAWSTENSVTLAQYKVDAKTNEITALKELINLLDIKGAMISIDAIGCQKEIAKLITDAQADYLLALKGNQQGLEQEVINLFKHGAIASTDTTQGITGNRIETRTCSVITNIDLLDEKAHWSKLTSVIKVESTREIKEKTQTETRYYISSANKSAQQFNQRVRSHWQIENTLHWQLDVCFTEDKSRKRKGNSDQNFSLLNKTALNILKTKTTDKASIANKRYKAALDENYLKNIIQNSCV